MNSLSKSVAQDIMRRIIAGEYHEDRPLPKEEEFAESYAVSRVVVREAKKQLQALGMIHSRKRAGSHILPKIKWNFFSQDLFSLYLDLGDESLRLIENFYGLRLLLEPDLAASVARSHSAGFIRDMEKVMRTIVLEYETEEKTNLPAADLDFHLRIYQESDNMFLLPIGNLIRPIFLHGLEPSWCEPETDFKDHLELFDAIRARQERKAAESARKLLLNARDKFKKITGFQP